MSAYGRKLVNMNDSRPYHAYIGHKVGEPYMGRYKTAVNELQWLARCLMENVTEVPPLGSS